MSPTPNILLQGVIESGSIWLHDVGPETEVIIWRLSCPHCKTLMDLMNQETNQMISINIDDRVTTRTKEMVLNWKNITPYHVDGLSKRKLLRHFNVTHVPSVEHVEQLF